MTLPVASAVYRLDDSLADSSGYARPLAGGSPVYAAGKFGQALSGGSPSREDDLLGGLGIAAGPYSLSLWVYYGVPRDGTIQVTATSPGSAVIELNVQFTGNDFSVEWADGTDTLVTSGGVTAGSWHHVALVVGGGTAEVFIDGVVAGSVAGMSATGTFNVLGDFTVSITPGVGGARCDDLAVIRSALSAPDVAEIYASEVGRLYPGLGDLILGTVTVTRGIEGSAFVTRLVGGTVGGNP